MRRNNRKKLAMLFCMAFFALTGCGDKEDGIILKNPSTSEAISEANSETANQLESTIIDEVSYPVTVVGTDGKEVIFETEPQRIISMGPNITELMYSLGAEQKLVGRTDYCDYPEQVLEIDSVGTLYTPDVEKILSLEPDLVIFSTHFSEELKSQLEEAGISVLVLSEMEDITGVYTMIEKLGVAVNAQEKSKEVIDDMKERIFTVEEAIKDDEPVSVYYVVGYGDLGDYTAGGDTFIHGILTASGGKNVAENVNGWSYSTENLLEADPEVILLSKFDYNGFTTTEPYTELSAVKNGNVYTIDTNMLDRQCARNADAIEQIAQILHPEAFVE